MNEDPYAILGVKREATQDEIRSAYRRLAKQLHPDLNPGDKQAEEKFKQVSGAYDILGDPEKRGRFDRGEIDASGMERPRERYYRDFHTADAQDHAYTSTGGFADFMEGEDVLADILGRGSGRARFRMRGSDMHYRLPVEFMEAVNGTTKRITMPDGATLDVVIPAGTKHQQVLRLRGKGAAGIGGGPPGDALVEVEVPTALIVHPQGGRHPYRAAHQSSGGRAGREARRAHADGAGAHDGAERSKYRKSAQAQRQGRRASGRQPGR